MLTAERVRACDGPLALLRELGYPVQPVRVDPVEWRRGGIVIEWNGEARLELASRLPRLDLFVLDGAIGDESIAKFLTSYASYNALTKSAIIKSHELSSISIYDLSCDKELRRLDVDLAGPSVHALDRLNLLAHGEDSTRIFDRALDRESVTRQFFLRFRDAVAQVGAELRACFPDEKKEPIESQALLILSRLLFLSFIQEKGWLNRERRFLVDRLDAAIRDGREFFAGVLVPLFFGCLNTPRTSRTPAARQLGRIPYLNGGLFEPSPFERRHGGIHLSNDLLRGVIEEVFERFDFRIDESDAAGTHVDPEMLGHVFESLMAEEQRAASGSFYTPKEIVDVLTEGAIDEWLRGTPTAREALQKLERITVLDPACGSGAFLLSALGAIERRHRRLAVEVGVSVPRDLRQRIVERSLYGVDLEPGAVRLCELRLWLAIVSDSDREPESVPPLPNLDRNVLQGNSLLSPTDFLGDGRADVYRDWLHALRAQRDLIERYRSAPRRERPALNRLLRDNDRRLATDLLLRSLDAAEEELRLAVAPQRDLFGRALAPDVAWCRELHARIADNRSALGRVEDGELDFFSFDVHFAHVMSNGGFDIVAGNPPWVRNGRIEPRMKRMIADRYPLFRGRGSAAAFHQPDLSIAFFERAMSLAARDGVVAMLMPAKVANAAYAAPLRRALQSRTIVEIADWSGDPRRRFQADVFPMGIITSRRAAPSVRITAAGETFALPQRDLLVDDEWMLVPPDAGAILRRLHIEHGSLEEVLCRRPLMGVKTGDNRAFFLEATKLAHEHLVTTDGVAIPLTAVCRSIRGRDVRRWHYNDSGWMLWWPKETAKARPRWLLRLAARRGVAPDSLRLAFARAEHLGIKVVWKDLARGMSAVVVPHEVQREGRPFAVVPNQTLYFIDCATLDEARVLAAILNSVVVDALLLGVADRAKDGHYRYFARVVARMPFPRVGPKEWEQLERLSRHAHAGERVDVDGVVAELYGVTAAELEVLRRFVRRRLGAP